MDTPQKSLTSKVRANIIKNELIKKGDRVLVALSGGPDSVCLFSILLALREKLGFDLLACHFNHRLRGKESDRDEEFVRKLCLDQNIELIVEKAPEANLYQSEDQARIARYRFFETVLTNTKSTKVAIAHHSNDSAETYLMRLIRGSGLRGLRSIQNIRGVYIRPLLVATRTEIEKYLKENGISFRIDRTNKNKTYLRNWIRIELIPKLQKANPNIVASLALQSRLISNDYNFLEEMAAREYRQVLFREKKDQIILNAKDWLLLHPSMQSMVLRRAIAELSGLDDISSAQIDDVINMVKKGEGNKLKILPFALIIALSNGKIILYKK